MILVHRICADCSRRFAQWWKSGDQSLLDRCQDCTARLHDEQNGTMDSHAH